MGTMSCTDVSLDVATEPVGVYERKYNAIGTLSRVSAIKGSDILRNRKFRRPPVALVVFGRLPCILQSSNEQLRAIHAVDCIRHPALLPSVAAETSSAASPPTGPGVPICRPPIIVRILPRKLKYSTIDSLRPGRKKNSKSCRVISHR